MADSEEATQQSEEEKGDSSSSSKGSFLDRMKKAPPWVWIGLAIAAATLIIGYIALRNQSSSSSSLTPSSTSGNNPSNVPGTNGQGLGNGHGEAGPYASQGEYYSLENEIQRLQQEFQQWHQGRGGHGGSGGSGKGHKKMLQSQYAGPMYTIGG